MSLGGALSIASSGLANINRQLAIISQNVANASTPGYAREIGTQYSLTAEGVGMGVVSGPATRDVDASLQANIFDQNATVAALQTRQSALQAIDAVQGSTGSGNDLASLLGNVQDAFSTLAVDPSNQTQQAAVVQSAATLASGINTLSNAYATQRQAAQDGIVADVGTLNTTLSTISQLSDRIISLKASGQSTADLESQRDAAVQTISSLLDVRTIGQQNGDVTLLTSSGLTLPLRSASGPFSVANATAGSGAYYPGGGLPGIMLGGADVTGQMSGGTIGANLTLRDKTLPTDQAELDEFSQNLASRFDAQGLRLFTDGAGAVPAGGGTPAQAGYVGFASEIGVNPAVRATPLLVRDGTQSVIGSSTGPSSFTPNPSTGPTGFTTLISRVLTFALGSEAQSGVPQPASATGGLGPTGTLSAPYAAPAPLGGIASTLVAAQSADSAAATQDLSSEQDVQTALQSKLQAQSGVSVDTEMSLMLTLQNAYAANAKVISSVQSMWDQLLGMVQS